MENLEPFETVETPESRALATVLEFLEYLKARQAIGAEHAFTLVGLAEEWAENLVAVANAKEDAL